MGIAAVSHIGGDVHVVDEGQGHLFQMTDGLVPTALAQILGAYHLVEVLIIVAYALGQPLVEGRLLAALLRIGEVSL